MFGRTAPQDSARAARKAERAAMLAAERDATRIRDKRYRIEEKGYSSSDGTGYGITVRDDGSVTVGDPELGDAVTGPLHGATASIETAGTVASRVTVPRVAALGVLALTVPKRSTRLYIVVQGERFEGVVPVDAANPDHLHRWIAWFNTRAARAE